VGVSGGNRRCCGDRSSSSDAEGDADEDEAEESSISLAGSEIMPIRVIGLDSYSSVSMFKEIGRDED
jgi:hypothetical protein